MSLATIRSAAAMLVPWGRQFADAGAWRLYVVGGAVRSLLGGTPLGPGDEVDMTTDARPEVVRRILGGWADTVWTQGERFGTVGCRHGERTVEITTHRAEVYAEGSRRPEVTYGGDLLADLTRRDFTIGAMAFEVPAGAAAAETVELIDPFGGREDLARGRLRTPRSAELSFSEDPLRILRAGRFVATLGLTAEPDLEAAMRRLRGRLAIVSAERCARELSLLLVAGSAAAGADLLARTGVLVQIVPELAAAGPDAARRRGTPGLGGAGGVAAAGRTALAGARRRGQCRSPVALSRCGGAPGGAHRNRGAVAARRCFGLSPATPRSGAGPPSAGDGLLGVGATRRGGGAGRCGSRRVRGPLGAAEIPRGTVGAPTAQRIRGHGASGNRRGAPTWAPRCAISRSCGSPVGPWTGDEARRRLSEWWERGRRRPAAG